MGKKNCRALRGGKGKTKGPRTFSQKPLQEKKKKKQHPGGGGGGGGGGGRGTLLRKKKKRWWGGGGEKDLLPCRQGTSKNTRKRDRGGRESDVVKEMKGRKMRRLIRPGGARGKTRARAQRKKKTTLNRVAGEKGAFSLFAPIGTKRKASAVAKTKKKGGRANYGGETSERERVRKPASFRKAEKEKKICARKEKKGKERF